MGSKAPSNNAKANTDPAELICNLCDHPACSATHHGGYPHSLSSHLILRLYYSASPKNVPTMATIEEAELDECLAHLALLG